MQNGTRHPELESTIHLPSAGPGAPKTDVACRVLTIDGRRMHLQSPQPVPSALPLSVEHEDALYLGEVVHCLALDCVYEVEVEVEQVLTGLQSLVSLRARLLDEQNAALQDARSGRRPMLSQALESI